MQRMQESYGSGIDKMLEYSNVNSNEKFSMDRIREDRDLIQFTLKTPEVQIEVEEVDSQISEDAGKGK
jgi:predicted HTH transcriptional regulator